MREHEGQHSADPGVGIPGRSETLPRTADVTAQACVVIERAIEWIQPG